MLFLPSRVLIVAALNLAFDELDIVSNLRVVERHDLDSQGFTQSFEVTRGLAPCARQERFRGSDPRCWRCLWVAANRSECFERHRGEFFCKLLHFFDGLWHFWSASRIRTRHSLR